MLQYINRARSNPFAEGQRLGIDIREGLQNPSYVGPRPPLAMNRLLLGIAEAHSSDMYNGNYFSHNDPNGNTPFDRMIHAGYNFALAGEDMAAGTGMSATSLEDFMMVDPGTAGRPHRVNLLDIWPYPCGNPPCIYSEIGVGYYDGPTSNSISNAFITEDFGATANTGPFLLGVVYNDRNGNNFYDIGEGVAGITITPSTGGYYAISSSSGGYAFPIGTSGTVTVTASGSGFGPITKTLTLTGTNIELDFTPQGSSVTTVSQSVTQTMTKSATTSTTQTSFQTSTTTSTTQTSYQTFTQTSSSSTTQAPPPLITFQSTPGSFVGATVPGIITACGNAYVNSQSASGCGASFVATANLPTPSTGWEFNHWAWAGGVVCSSDTSNPVTCSASGSGGILMAAYAAQVNVATNPASSALISWDSCSNPGVGDGASFFSTNYGPATVTACNLPAGYSFSGWTCAGGLACLSSVDPTTATFTGPGTITLNLQPVTFSQTSTQSITSSDTVQSTSSDSATTTTMINAPEFSAQTIILGATVVAAMITLTMRKRQMLRKAR